MKLGNAKLSAANNGDQIVQLPLALVACLDLRAGDTLSISPRKAGGWTCRFYRIRGGQCFRLLPGTEPRRVGAPR